LMNEEAAIPVQFHLTMLVAQICPVEKLLNSNPANVELIGYSSAFSVTVYVKQSAYKS